MEDLEYKPSCTARNSEEAAWKTKVFINMAAYRSRLVCVAVVAVIEFENNKQTIRGAELRSLVESVVFNLMLTFRPCLC